VVTNTKIPEIRQEAFTKARESLGLSTKELSVMACLSVRQIEQIENGEGSAFYGAQIKFTAAKKVAGLLKMEPGDAFDFGEVAQPVKVTEVQEQLPEETKAFTVENQEKSEKEDAKELKEAKQEDASSEVKIAESSPAELKSELVSASNISEVVLDYRVQSKSKSDPKNKVFLLLAIGGAVVFSAVNLRPLVFPEPAIKEPVVIQEAVQEPAPAAEPVVDTKQVAVVMPAPTPVAVSTDCPPADTSAFNYKPDAPKKAGDMVYLQAKTAQTFCVVDATGKTQNKTLEPGVGVSLYGKPPFKVLTSGLNQFDMYFQGGKVRTSNTASKTIILEAAEVIQPLAPSTSTDSQLR
jgi:transcriptional regulator with XRE-family HTH domain